MTLQTFNFNAGTQGAAVVAAGNLSVSGTGIVYDSAYASEGLRGAKVPQPASTQLMLGIAFTANNSFAITFYMRADTQLSGQGREFFNLKAGGAAWPLALGWSATNQISWTDGVGGQAFITPSAGAMLANQWYRFAITGTTTGSAGATGSVSIKIYAGDSLTPSWTYSSSTFNFGAGTPNNIVIGGLQNDRTAAWTFGLDYINVNDGSTTEIGPPGNAAPTATITGNQNVAAGATVSATMSASDSDGTIASYLWTVVSGSSTATPTLTNSTTATVSFTAPAAGNVVTLQCVATDNGGATVTKLTEVRVPIAGSTAAVPLPGAGAGGSAWTIIGGSASEGAALNDGNTATLVESADMTSTPQERIFRLQPMNSRSALVVTVSNAVLTSTATHTSKVRVYQGTLASGVTQVAEGSISAVSTSASSPTYSLTTGELAAITDWGDVRVSLVASL